MSASFWLVCVSGRAGAIFQQGGHCQASDHAVRAGSAGVRAMFCGLGHELLRVRRVSGVLSGSSGGFFQHGLKGFGLFGTVGAEAAAFLRTGLLCLYL
jgi:hypothetical protein